MKKSKYSITTQELSFFTQITRLAIEDLRVARPEDPAGMQETVDVLKEVCGKVELLTKGLEERNIFNLVIPGMEEEYEKSKTAEAKNEIKN